MPATVDGVKTLSILQFEESGSIDRYGVDTITRVEEIPLAGFPSLLRAKFSVHPLFPSMAVRSVSWQRGHGGAFYRVTYTYEGFLISLPEPTYEFSGALDEDPIQTHKDFLTLAGTPAAPLNGAIFLDPDTGKITADNTKGVFREFKAMIGPVANPKAGVEAYLNPGGTWTEVAFSLTRPTDLGDLGKTDSPAGTEPTMGSGRTWLYYDVSYKTRGFIFEIRKTWKISGRNGWDTDIY